MKFEERLEALRLEKLEQFEETFNGCMTPDDLEKATSAVSSLIKLAFESGYQQALDEGMR